MGCNSSSELTPPFVIFSDWSFEESIALKDQYIINDYDFGIDAKIIQKLCEAVRSDVPESFGEDILKAFSPLDTTATDIIKVNALSLLSGVIFFCVDGKSGEDTILRKSEVIFDVFSFEGGVNITLDEMTICLMSVFRAISIMIGTPEEPTDAGMEQVCADVFNSFDEDPEDCITKGQFVSWTSSLIGNEMRVSAIFEMFKQLHDIAIGRSGSMKERTGSAHDSGEADNQSVSSTLLMSKTAPENFMSQKVSETSARVPQLGRPTFDLVPYRAPSITELKARAEKYSEALKSLKLGATEAETSAGAPKQMSQLGRPTFDLVPYRAPSITELKARAEKYSEALKGLELGATTAIRPAESPAAVPKTETTGKKNYLYAAPPISQILKRANQFAEELKKLSFGKKPIPPGTGITVLEHQLENGLLCSTKSGFIQKQDGPSTYSVLYPRYAVTEVEDKVASKYIVIGFSRKHASIVKSTKFIPKTKEEYQEQIDHCKILARGYADILQKLKESKKSSERPNQWPVGYPVSSKFCGIAWRPGSIAGVNSDGSYNVLYDHGAKEICVLRKDIRGLLSPGCRVVANFCRLGLWREGRIDSMNENYTFNVQYQHGAKEVFVSPKLVSPIFRVSDSVLGNFCGVSWREGEIIKENNDNTYNVKYANGAIEVHVAEFFLKFVSRPRLLRLDPHNDDSGSSKNDTMKPKVVASEFIFEMEEAENGDQAMLPLTQVKNVNLHNHQQHEKLQMVAKDFAEEFCTHAVENYSRKVGAKENENVETNGNSPNKSGSISHLHVSYMAPTIDNLVIAAQKYSLQVVGIDLSKFYRKAVCKKSAMNVCYKPIPWSEICFFAKRYSIERDHFDPAHFYSRAAILKNPGKEEVYKPSFGLPVIYKGLRGSIELVNADGTCNVMYDNGRLEKHVEKRHLHPSRRNSSLESDDPPVK